MGLTQDPATTIRILREKLTESRRECEEAESRGYERAMKDAADRAMGVASSYGSKPSSGYAEGAQDALHALADDLEKTAAAEKEERQHE